MKGPIHETLLEQRLTEVYLTAEIYDAFGVTPLLNSLSVEPKQARPKGVGQEMSVYRVAV